MDINENTKILEILEKYPVLKTKLAELAPQAAAMLDNPLGKMAVGQLTVKDVAERCNVAADQAAPQAKAFVEGVVSGKISLNKDELKNQVMEMLGLKG